MRSTLRFALATLPLFVIAQDSSSTAAAVDVVPITIDGQLPLLSVLFTLLMRGQVTSPASLSQHSVAKLELLRP
jgi:hypothetical protein